MKNFLIKVGKVTLGVCGLLVCLITLVNETYKLADWVSTKIKKRKEVTVK